VALYVSQNYVTIAQR